ncbi:MAG: RNA polymerase sigma factor [Planctomycetota bacterium]
MSSPDQTPQTEPSDDAGVRVMLAYQAGNEAAFDELVVAYSAQVYALLTRFLGPVAAREDLVQEVFLRVIRARDRYQPTARFSTWLYRIVFNICVNEKDRRARRQEVSLEGPSGASEAAGAYSVEDEQAPDPSSGLEREDAVSAVRRAIAALPEKQRLALVLAKYEELPYAEIARVMDSSEKAIKSLVHRARETLRETLRPFLQEDAA